MHSWPIMVESMSAKNSLFRRAASWTTRSTGRQRFAHPNDERAVVVFAPAKTMSAATPGSSHRVCRAPHDSARVLSAIGARGDGNKGRNEHEGYHAGGADRRATASGKSALALAIAEALAGWWSMPTRCRSTATAHPHRSSAPRSCASSAPSLRPRRRRQELFGRLLGEARDGSAAGRALQQDAGLRRRNRLGFKALTGGLADFPPIPVEVRKTVRERAGRRNPAGAARPTRAPRCRDGGATETGRQGNGVARALEVVLATGRPLSDWHREHGPPLLDPAQTVKPFVASDRANSIARIDARFDAMLAAGALDEVSRSADAALDPQLPIMKAHGVPWLIRHLAGGLTLAKKPRARSSTFVTMPSGSTRGFGISWRTGPRSRRECARPDLANRRALTPNPARGRHREPGREHPPTGRIS